MVEATRPLFISFSSEITKENENGEDIGTLEVFTQIQDCQVTNEELLEIKKIQEEAAEKINELLNHKESEDMWQSKVKTIDFEKNLMLMYGLSKNFIPGSKKLKFMLDYDSQQKTVYFTLFKVQEEIKDKSQIEKIEKMEMIKFYDWIKSFDDLSGTGLEQMEAFTAQRSTIEKILENVPCLADKIRLKNKMRVIADYDPQQEEVIFKHYIIE